jgi:thioesterase domain-containing protein
MAPCDCSAVLLKTKLDPWDHPDRHDGWRKLFQGSLTVREVSGGHLEILREPHVRVLAAALAEFLGPGQTAPRSLRGSGAGGG